MSCNNCFNNCTEIVSDKCVRYTGETVPGLNITTGDTLLSVEQNIIDKVYSFLNGAGITITVDPAAYCELVTKYLPPCFPECGSPNLVELLTALVKAACDLQVQVDALDAAVAEINGPYDVDCLTGVTGSSTTHEVLQAVITKLCDLGVDLAALALDVDTNYVKLADLNTLIQAYLDSIAPGVTQYYQRMIPYTAVEYYGSLANFDVTGKGLVSAGFDKIYLCNGLNGTPDKRGRVAVGAIVGVPGGALDSAVNPAFPGNPNYSILDSAGANTVTLTAAQMPLHTHTALANSTSIVTDPGHTHVTSFKASQADLDEAGISGILMNRDTVWNSTANTTSATTGISVSTTTTVTNADAGLGQGHSNIQPVKACYYIMYIP